MKSSKTSFLRNCISGWNVRISCKNSAMKHLTKFFPTFVTVSYLTLECALTIKPNIEMI